MLSLSSSYISAQRRSTRRHPLAVTPSRQRASYRDPAKLTSPPQLAPAHVLDAHAAQQLSSSLGRPVAAVMRPFASCTPSAMPGHVAGIWIGYPRGRVWPCVCCAPNGRRQVSFAWTTKQRSQGHFAIRLHLAADPPAPQRLAALIYSAALHHRGRVDCDMLLMPVETQRRLLL